MIDPNYNNCLLALYICITLQNDDFTHTKIMETYIRTCTTIINSVLYTTTLNIPLVHFMIYIMSDLLIRFFQFHKTISIIMKLGNYFSSLMSLSVNERSWSG